MSADAPKTAGSTPLARTPLHALHVRLGARMVPFAGYDMPVQYPLGVLKEHLHTRAAAGLFDVSHMGQIVVRAKSGNAADSALALERLVPADIAGLAPGRQRYSYFTNDTGGILDDLMIANLGDRHLVVVNAACKAADEAHLRAHLEDTCTIEVLDRALIALQGPAAEAALSRLAPACQEMRFMDVRAMEICGASCMVSRSGYTGEDGFEISTPADAAVRIAESLLEDANVQPIGLGARDSLRLEAGLPLYGSDIDTTTTPVEAGLQWAIQKVRREVHDDRPAFPGCSIVREQLTSGAVRRRVGLRPEGKAPIRAGVELYADAADGAPIGVVTSGGFGPSVEAPVAMGYVPAALAKAGTQVFALVRGQRLPVRVSDLPFTKANFKRG